MKRFLKQSLAATLGSAALMSIHPSALAAWTYDTLHATACVAAGGADPAIRAEVGGIRNTAGAAVTVLCPVMRTIAAPTTGYRVYANGSALVGACWLHSRAATGEALWSALMTGADSGRRVTAVLPSDSPTQSAQVIECKLPPGGAIYSLEFVQ